MRNGRKISSSSPHAAGDCDSEPACSGSPVAIAAAAAPAYDSVQRCVQMVPGGNGVICGVQADGALIWYRNTGGQNDSSGWVNGGAGVALNNGWQQFRTVLASTDGRLFGFLTDGRCLGQ